MLNFILISLFIAAVAVTYSCILVDADMLLVGWRKYLFSKLMKRKMFNAQNGFGGGHDHPENRFKDHPILFKLAIDCERCIAGQMALWSWLIYAWPAYIHISGLRSAFIQISIHIIIISLSIVWTCIIKKTYQWTKKN